MCPAIGPLSESLWSPAGNVTARHASVRLTVALSDWGQLAWHPLEPEGGSAVQQSEHEEQERTDWRVPQVIDVLSLHVRHSTPKHELVQSAAPSSKRLASRRPRKTRPILTRIRLTPGARGSLAKDGTARVALNNSRVKERVALNLDVRHTATNSDSFFFFLKPLALGVC